MWRWWVLVMIVAAAFPGQVGWAQDDVKPEQLRKMYTEVLDQLKNAQERKNQLATENEQLQAKVQELQKKLDIANGKVTQLQKDAAGYAEKTFYLRSYYMAWQQFLKRYPHLMARWKVFLENGQLDAPHDLPEFIDPEWPLPAQG